MVSPINGSTSLTMQPIPLDLRNIDRADSTSESIWNRTVVYGKIIRSNEFSDKLFGEDLDTQGQIWIALLFQCPKELPQQDLAFHFTFGQAFTESIRVQIPKHYDGRPVPAIGVIKHVKVVSPGEFNKDRMIYSPSLVVSPFYGLEITSKLDDPNRSSP